MPLSAAQQAQLAQLQAQQAAAAVEDGQALIAVLNDPTIGGVIAAKCDALLADASADSALAIDVANLKNVLTLSAGNIANRLVPLQQLAATAAQPAKG